MKSIFNSVILLGLFLVSALASTSTDDCLFVYENSKVDSSLSPILQHTVASRTECSNRCFEIGYSLCSAYQYNAVSGLCELFDEMETRKAPKMIDDPNSVFVELSEKCFGTSTGSTSARVKRYATGQWGQWGAWGQCTASCGGGQQTRVRQCSVYGACGYGGNSGVQQCNAGSCCTEWTAWSPCSVTCGSGQQTHERRCPVPGNTYQSKPETATQPCTGTMPTCATWSDWAPWGACSVTCGTGQAGRQRPCTGGTACVGNGAESQACDKGPCYTWSSWSEWGECTTLCGGGSRNRTRQCPQDGGCSGLNDGSDVCNMMPCPDWGDWSPWSDCTITCGGGTRSRTRSCPLPKACTPGEEYESDATPCGAGTCPTWAAWTDWGACSRTCGEGNRKRSRTCNGGDGCLGSGDNVEPCFDKPCTLGTEWSQWSPCTATCGGGTQTRSRVKCPAGPPTCPIEEANQPCSPEACPGWGPWAEWGTCSKTCGGGQRTRTRTCPVTNGCVGQATDIDPQPCNAIGCNTAAARSKKTGRR